MTADRPVTAPLSGVRVLEVGNWMAAPGTAAMMADLGADVVKVEPLTGDPVRGKIRQPFAANGRGTPTPCWRSTRGSCTAR